jgi:hypothetical protein
MSDSHVYEHAATFEQHEVTGNLRLHKYEAYYEQLFSEALADGVITAEERGQLNRMGDQLGLDPARLRQLEEALKTAYEAHRHVRVREAEPGFAEDDSPRASLSPLEPATDARTLALQRRVVYLERRVADLERDLEEARAQVSVEVDFSDLEAAGDATVTEDDVAALLRRARHDPRDPETLHALYRAHARSGDVDRQWCVAQVLSFLGAADADEKATFEAHDDGAAIIKPRSSLHSDSWQRLLLHPDQEILTGEIMSVIVPAVLLGRIATLRHQKALPTLDPQKLQDPKSSTLAAVRCFVWGAAIFGMTAPPLYADTDFAGAVEMVPGMPPASRLGKLALSGRSPDEVAFIAGRHMSFYREEHFMRMLMPDVQDLEDLFLAALVIGNPGLPLAGNVKQRVAPIAKAIEPLLEAAQLDRLRGHFLRFVEEGGRTNLQRWASAVDRTAARAGLVLANNLVAAQNMLAAERVLDPQALCDDLLVFATSDRYAKLRKHIGVAIQAS